MSQTILEMTTDLVIAQIHVKSLLPEGMRRALQQTYVGLMELKTREQKGAMPPAPIDWRTSITRHAIICLECGAAYKQLSSRHLRQHELDGRSYRAKYGIPRSQPLTARSVTAVRKMIAQRVRPWEKAPTFVKAQRERK